MRTHKKLKSVSSVGFSRLAKKLNLLLAMAHLDWFRGDDSCAKNIGGIHDRVSAGGSDRRVMNEVAIGANSDMKAAHACTCAVMASSIDGKPMQLAISSDRARSLLCNMPEIADTRARAFISISA